MQSVDEQIESFLKADAIAVAGASDEKHKYGHKVYVCYLENNRKVYPINPNAQTVMGDKAYPNLSALPEPVQSVSIITPPAVTNKIVDEAIKLGVRNLWMQPGAESAQSVRKAKEAGINVICGGPCVLVVLGYHGD